jgi:hypothetical protein
MGRMVAAQHLRLGERVVGASRDDEPRQKVVAGE